MDREYYLHFAGHKAEFEIEAIYERHARAVRARRGRRAAGAPRARRRGDERAARALPARARGRRAASGRRPRREEAALAEREAALEIEVDGEPRALPPEPRSRRPTSPTPERRAAIEGARLDVLDARAQPAAPRGARARARAGARAGLAELPRDVRGAEADRPGRARAADAALPARRPTDALPRPRSSRSCARRSGFGFDELRRSDLPYFFRAPGFDDAVSRGAADRRRFERTLAGLGIDLDAQPNVRLDTEQRPQKSPRAFCAPVHVPRRGLPRDPAHGRPRRLRGALPRGRATPSTTRTSTPSLPFEFRHLGDNSVTEGFAFLFEHLTEDPAWLRDRARRRGRRRRTSATRAPASSSSCAATRPSSPTSSSCTAASGRWTRCRRCTRGCWATRSGVDWPRAHLPVRRRRGLLRRQLPARLGVRDAPARRAARALRRPSGSRAREAGDLLRAIWREGQRLDADELLAEVTGERLDFGVMLDEV